MKVYALPKTQHIVKRAKQKQGLPRLFRWVRSKAPVHGETLVLAYILLSVKEIGIVYPRNTISRVIKKEFEEKSPSQAKNWLRDFGVAK